MILGWAFEKGVVEFTQTDAKNSSKGKTSAFFVPSASVLTLSDREMRLNLQFEERRYPRMLLRFKMSRRWRSTVAQLVVPIAVVWMGPELSSVSYRALLV